MKSSRRMINFWWLRGNFDLLNCEIMRPKKNLADYNHPLVVQKARELTRGVSTDRGKIEKLFYYVRDEIRYGFLKELDYLTASDIIRRKMGQSNNKGILFFSLCKALDIPVRMHFSIINKAILRGLFTGLAYKILSEQISHCWIEVLVEDTWRSIDTYICDEDYYRAAMTELNSCSRDSGYPLACPADGSGLAFNIDQEEPVLMDAVVLDQGVYDDPSDYFYSMRYVNRFAIVKFFIFQHVIIPWVNRRTERMRLSRSYGVCGEGNAAGWKCADIFNTVFKTELHFGI